MQSMGGIDLVFLSYLDVHYISWSSLLHIVACPTGSIVATGRIHEPDDGPHSMI